MISIRQVSARTVLNKSKIFDYCLNPFTGCAIGCVCCYARLFIGIPTFAFIGPILPGNPESLVARLEGTVDRILVDRMNYLPGVRGMYRRLGLEEAAQDRFFQEYRQRLISALQQHNMAYEVFF